MTQKNKFFIAIYTNEVKNYCDERFFENLHALSQNEPVFVVDNTIAPGYSQFLRESFSQRGYSNFHLHHLPVPEQPKSSQFQRNVCDSVSLLRDLFLRSTDLPHFLIIESDVLAPVDLLDRFEVAIQWLNHYEPGWGIIGGLYYRGFHNFDFDSRLSPFEKTAHCLSGCTVYKRALIERFPFRYDPQNLGPFPDAWISYDARGDFTQWNDHRINCDHLYNQFNGTRMSRSL
jgi:hypothetical protein